MSESVTRSDTTQTLGFDHLWDSSSTLGDSTRQLDKSDLDGQHDCVVLAESTSRYSNDWVHSSWSAESDSSLSYLSMICLTQFEDLRQLVTSLIAYRQILLGLH